jgi:CheY-like chemotaxis protein
MKPRSPRILIIDDDGTNCELIQLMLQISNPDYEVTSVLTPEEGLRLAATQRFDLYVLDYRLRGLTGIEVCRTLRQTHADTRIMFFTGEAHERERQEAMQAGADAYLVKPDHLANLTETAARLLDAHKPAAMWKAPLKSYRPDVSI